LDNTHISEADEEFPQVEPRPFVDLASHSSSFPLDAFVLSLLQAALATSDFLAGSDANGLLARREVEVCVMAVDADQAVLNQLVKAYVEREQGVTKVMVRGGKRWL
jgi:hypothetical protein